MNESVTSKSRCVVRIFLIAMIGWLGVLPVTAQVLKPVVVRLLWFDPGNPPPELVNVGPDEGKIACVFRANTLSEVHGLFAAGGVLRFLGKEDQKVFVDVKVAGDVERAILVFLPAAKVGEGDAAAAPRVFVINEAPENFPPGGAFVANFHSGDIRFVVGEHRTQLRPGGTTGVKQPQERDDFNMAPVIVQFQQGDAWRTGSESVVRFIPETRYLILAYVDPASGRPRISTFTDVVPPVQPGAE